MNDNFNDGIIGTQWIVAGTPTEADGVVKMDYGDYLFASSSIPGDFDFQIDFLNYIGAGTGEHNITMSLWVDANNYAFITRCFLGSTESIYGIIVIGGSVVVNNAIGWNNDYGKLRGIRVGGSLSLQYYNGATWVNVGNSGGFPTANIFLNFNNGTSSGTYVEFDNFVANVGSWGILAQSLLNQKWLLHPLPDLIIPIESFSGRVKNGEPTYLSVNVPNGKIWADDLAERMDNEIVIIREGILSDGTVDSREIVRVNLEDVRLDRGARNSTISLTGHKTVTTEEVKRVALDGVTYRGEYGGKRHIRCRFDSNVRPGWTACFGEEEFTVGEISYRVGKNNAEMEIVEA